MLRFTMDTFWHVESSKIVADIESQIENAIRGAIGQTSWPVENKTQLPSPDEKTSPLLIKGKDVAKEG